MTNETKHTPTPVSIPDVSPEMIDMFGSVAILDAEGKLLCTVGRDKKCNYPIAERAEFIVRAVNVHDELVAAIEAMLPCTISGLSVHNSRAMALAALAKAREEA